MIAAESLAVSLPDLRTSERSRSPPHSADTTRFLKSTNFHQLFNFLLWWPIPAYRRQIFGCRGGCFGGRHFCRFRRVFFVFLMATEVTAWASALSALAAASVGVVRLTFTSPYAPWPPFNLVRLFAPTCRISSIKLRPLCSWKNCIFIFAAIFFCLFRFPLPKLGAVTAYLAHSLTFELLGRIESRLVCRLRQNHTYETTKLLNQIFEHRGENYEKRRVPLKK